MTNPPETGPGWQSLPGFREEPQGPAAGYTPDAELADLAAALKEAEAGQ